MALLKIELMDNDHKSYGKQGVYLNRNGRLISKGGALKGVWRLHPTTNAARVEIYFNEESDNDFGLTSTKNRANLKQGLSDALSPEIKFLLAKAKSRQNKSPNTNEQTAALNTEEERFSDKLKQFAGVLGLPSSVAKDPEGKKITRTPGEKKGTVAPKGTEITRSPRSRIVPTFDHRAMPHNPSHVWYDYGDSDSSELMIITINTSHPFIVEHYTNGSGPTKSALRKEWTASCISLHQHFNESTYNIIEEYRQDVASTLKKLQKVI